MSFGIVTSSTSWREGAGRSWSVGDGQWGPMVSVKKMGVRNDLYIYLGVVISPQKKQLLIIRPFIGCLHNSIYNW